MKNRETGERKTEDFFLLIVCFMCTSVKVSDPRELEIPTVLSCLVGAGLNLGPFGRTVSALNH